MLDSPLTAVSSSQAASSASMASHNIQRAPASTAFSGDQDHLHRFLIAEQRVVFSYLEKVRLLVSVVTYHLLYVLAICLSFALQNYHCFTGLTAQLTAQVEELAGFFGVSNYINKAGFPGYKYTQIHFAVSYGRVPCTARADMETRYRLTAGHG